MNDTAITVKGVPIASQFRSPHYRPSPTAEKSRSRGSIRPRAGLTNNTGPGRGQSIARIGTQEPQQEPRQQNADNAAIFPNDELADTETILGGAAANSLRPIIRIIRVGEEPAPWPARPLLPEPPDSVPDPTQLCGTVVRAAIEVLAGLRSAQQLSAWVTPQVLHQLQLRAQLERTGPTMAAIPDRRLAARVRHVRLHRIGDHAEATVLIDTPDRVRAAAARLAVHRGVWRVCVLEIA